MDRCQITVPTDKHPRLITSVPAVLAGSQWLKALGFSSKLLMGSENLVFIFKSHLFSFHTADILSDSRYLPFLFQWLSCGRKKRQGQKKEKQAHTKCNGSNKTTRSYSADKFVRDKTTIPKVKQKIRMNFTSGKFLFVREGSACKGGKSAK